MTTEKKQANGKADLGSILGAVWLGEPRVWNNLQVFPLEGGNGHAPAYSLLDDLLERGQAEVLEVSEHGSVPRLRVRNLADVDGLLLDGMELRGAKQNRMVNVTIVVGKQSEAEIPVSCVEQGRWAYRSRNFASAKRTVAAVLRRSKASMVADSLAMQRGPETDQGRVWQDVDEYMDCCRIASPTMSFDDAYVSREGSVEDCVAELGGVQARGAVVVRDGKVVSLDLFDSDVTFAKAWPALLRGHAFDAVVRPGSEEKAATVEEVREWLQRLGAAKPERQQVPGVGDHFTVSSKTLVGSITLHEGRAVHTVLHAVESSPVWDEV